MSVGDFLDLVCACHIQKMCEFFKVSQLDGASLKADTPAKEAETAVATASVG